MSATAERTTVAIELEAECAQGESRGGLSCHFLASRTHEQLAGGSYAWPCSVMELPGSIVAWLSVHGTARRRAERCVAGGYVFLPIERAHWQDDIYEINVSAPARQGRPMSEGYTKPPRFSELPFQPCERHRIATYGVLGPDGCLRAYACIHRVGALAMVSQILGHAEHLEQGIMYLLVRGVLEEQIAAGPGVLFYNMHDSGTDGLRFFKERLGLAAAAVDWVLA